MGAFTWYWPRCHFPHKLHWPAFVCLGAGLFYRGRVYRRRQRTSVCGKQAAISIELNKRQTFVFWLWISGNSLYQGSHTNKRTYWGYSEQPALPEGVFWPFSISAIWFNSCRTAIWGLGLASSQVRSGEHLWACPRHSTPVPDGLRNAEAVNDSLRTRRPTEQNPQSSAWRTITEHDAPVNAWLSPPLPSPSAYDRHESIVSWVETDARLIVAQCDFLLGGLCTEGMSIGCVWYCHLSFVTTH